MRTIGARLARLGLAGGVALALTAGARGATTNYYYVSANSPSPGSPYGNWTTAAHDIQTAVTKAEGDVVPGTTECVVTVSNGLYTLSSQITIRKAITVKSLSGRSATTINGGYPASTNRCVEIAGNATLDGFNITNGLARGASPNNWGGGVFAHNGTVAIRNCTFRYNRACLANGEGGAGGGMALVTAVVSVADCVVAQNSVDPLANTSVSESGAGIYVTSCSGLIRDCMVSNNVMRTGGNGSGAGIYEWRYGSTALVVSNCTFKANRSSRYDANVIGNSAFTHCLFVQNYAASAGGGVSLGDYGARLYNSTVVSNSSGGEGSGGIKSSRGTVENCRIIGNSTTGLGGGMVAGDNNVKNCLVVANSAGTLGGGIYKMHPAGAAYKIENCTVSLNASVTGGGGIYTLATNRPMNLLNSIAYNNFLSGGAPSDIQASAAIGNWRDNVAYSCSPNLTAGVSNNIVGNPQFAVAGSGYGTTAQPGDYHLKVGSPCADSGGYQSWMATAKDLDGYARVMGGAVNRGAYEYLIPLWGSILLFR